ncbi:MAG: MFS transporter [Rhodospirillales bacterium]
MTIKESVTRNPIIETLSQPNYGRYVAGNSISLIGLWMHRIAVGWLTWKLTESGFWLGAVAFADLAPSIVIGPIGGALADRISRLLIVKVAQTIAMLQALLLAALFWTDAINIWLLLGLTFVNGVVIGFNQPSRLALVSSLVDKDHVSVAVAINSTVFNTARFIGPAAAGVVIVASDVGWAFLINAASYLAMLAALASIHILPETGAKKREKRGVLADIAEGIGYVRRHPGVGPMLFLMLVTAVCVRPFVELMPGFAADVYERGAEGLATLSSTVGIGAVLAGVWMASRRNKTDAAVIAITSPLIISVGIIIFASTDIYPVGVVAVAIAGFGMVASGVGMQTSIHLSVPSEIRGRVLSLFGIIFRGGPAFGALVIGAFSELFGLQAPTLVAAILALIIWFFIWLRRQQIIAAMTSDLSQD